VRRRAPWITEKQWQANVETIARLHGWMAYHTFDSRKSSPGFPDLVMLRGPRLVVAELKTERGRVGLAQRRWLDAFRRSGAEVFVWRPSDIQAVERVLR
jgi:hypothetical protein